MWFPIAQLPGIGCGFDDRGFFGVAPFTRYISRFVLRMAPPPSAKSESQQIVRKILKRPANNVDEEIEDADEIDAHNKETFPDESSAHWDFDEMLRANNEMFGVQSTYSDRVFEQCYSVPLATNRVEIEAFREEEEKFSFDMSELVSAFSRGWSSHR